MSNKLVELFHNTTGPCDCKDCKIEQLEAENQRLREAMKPLNKYKIVKDIDDRYHLYSKYRNVCIASFHRGTNGDVINIQKALEK